MAETIILQGIQGVEPIDPLDLSIQTTDAGTNTNPEEYLRANGWSFRNRFTSATTVIVRNLAEAGKARVTDVSLINKSGGEAIVTLYSDNGTTVEWVWRLADEEDLADSFKVGPHFDGDDDDIYVGVAASGISTANYVEVCIAGIEKAD